MTENVMWMVGVGFGTEFRSQTQQHSYNIAPELLLLWRNICPSKQYWLLTENSTMLYALQIQKEWIDHLFSYGKKLIHHQGPCSPVS